MTRRAGQSTTAITDERLYLAVLERVEGDDTKTATGTQQFLGSDQAAVQLIEFVIDVDTQRLKGPSRGIDAVARLWQNPAHDFGEVAGALDRRVLARRNDRLGNPPGGPLLTVNEQNAGEIGFGELVNRIGSGHTLLRVHTHVERAIRAEREAPLRPIHMHGRNPKIKGDAIDPADTGGVEKRDHVPETAAEDRQPAGIAPAEIHGGGTCLGVAIDPKYSAACGIEDRPRVTAATESGIKIDRSGARRQGIDDFRQHHRDMSKSRSHQWSPWSRRNDNVAPRARARSKAPCRCSR